MQKSPSREANNQSTSRETPCLYGTQRWITIHRSCHWHWTLSLMNTAQFSHPISLQFILILSSYLHLGLPNSLSLSDFLTIILYAFLFYSMHVICPTNILIQYRLILHLVNLMLISWHYFYKFLSHIYAIIISDYLLVKKSKTVIISVLFCEH
jgi:hypothetical protein